VTMLLSPLPKEQRVRHFYLSHGNLVDPDDQGDEEVDFDDAEELTDAEAKAYADAVAEESDEELGESEEE
jgi:hypothetical protein